MAAEVLYLRREKVLLDTSIYLSSLNRGLYADPIAHLIRSTVPYLHSIVFEELLAGVRSNDEIQALHQLKKPFAAAGRLLTPTDRDWEETGLLVHRMIHRGVTLPRQAVSLTHDVLLALSARRRGIRVITENRKDFERIRSLKDFKLTVWRPS